MINYIKGDLFSHIPMGNCSLILAHACNPRGKWGAGIAKTFKSQYKSTFNIHETYCKTHDNLLGSSQLIKSDSTDLGNQPGHLPVYVACLFTADLGQKHTPEQIVKYTETSLQDLIKQLKQSNQPFEQQDGKFVINMPKINAGLFFTPWEMTEKVLNKFDQDLIFNVYVLE